jgi:hypothetical protein
MIRTVRRTLAPAGWAAALLAAGLAGLALAYLRWS